MKRRIIYSTARGRTMDLDDLEKILEDARQLGMSRYRTHPIITVQQHVAGRATRVGAVVKVQVEDTR